ncbi:unnamed protein product [Penicillium nalgiovense]|uniref:Lipocalin-like domain-containing protein n=1 Tax=Penicillium nalgiovense TaxID=60175 RepID=A0A9W4I851_PENNA|nr:unnamed protein product [Penicillium nalgiovense]CAG7975550.1 unnamed protein product [Penicillium nalgiovense]CAG8022105.1 unnamed protein product [Penicillium nalgiovense]CAG8056964.1 unnamed protein product [Penicillium nalgiovense]CAG8059910.1 unnamed protein product [Penicillium nalgiovense]
MLSLSILPLLVFGLVCSAHPFEKRQSRPTDSFKLYAYGPGISGLPVFYRNVTAAENTWVAHPSSSSRSNEGFTTLSSNTNMLCLDQGDADSNPVSFTAVPAEGKLKTTKLSNVWSTYGGYVLVTVSGANFYARPTATDGLYSLLWSSSAEAMTDTIPVVLRTAEPATVSVLN